MSDRTPNIPVPNIPVPNIATIDPILGIDLGTTNSLIAILDPSGPRVLLDESGRALLPSVVRYETDAVVVGFDAKARAPEFPNTTISSVKRLMGRSARDAAADMTFLTYRVEAGDRDTTRVVIPAPSGTRSLSPEEVSAEVLRALKARAEAALGRTISRAVVTVPAYFDDAQRQATRTAGRLAGLDVVRIVPEPTAAALAYGLGLDRSAARNQKERVVAVFDLGGGTFDVSILRIIPGEDKDTGGSIYQVLSTSGDTHLGGDDFDHLLVALLTREIAELISRATGIDPSRVRLPDEARRGLLGLAEQIKIKLSDQDQTTVSVDLGLPGPDGSLVYRRVITRAEFESLIAPLIERAMMSCGAALRDAREAMAGAEIDAVLLVGGSTRVPLVRQRVAEFFKVEPYTAIDPDLVVALGAAVQGGVLSGQAKGTLLLDVIPLSLGIETVGGAVAKLIVRNSPVPARATEMFSTSADNQTAIRLTVFQGEREMAADCRKLGEFRLRALPPMPAGIPQVEVAFLVDANGVLTATALERRSGKRAMLQVVPNHGLTSDEVERIERDSITHAKEDMTRHRIVDLIANASLDLKWIGEGLARVGPALDPAYRTELEALTASLREFVARAKADWQSVDANAFHAAKDALDRASVRLQEISIAESLRGAKPKP